MRYLLILSILLVAACTSVDEKQADFNWLLGEWIRVNDAEGQHTFENWVKVNEDEYLGLGFTLQDRDTIFKENITLRKEGESWVFKVSGVNEQPTAFSLLTKTEVSFVVENKMNPFPKRIEYQRERNELNAIVSDEETQLMFHFTKKE